MKIHLKKWMRSAFVVSLLLGATSASAAITEFHEQVLLETVAVGGGNNQAPGGDTVGLWRGPGTAKAERRIATDADPGNKSGR